MHILELTDLELLYLRSLLGDGVGTEDSGSAVYRKVNNIATNKGFEYFPSKGEGYKKSPYIEAAYKALASFKTPLEKLLIKNGFKKSVQTLYTIQLGYNRVTADAENGTCTFEGNRIHPIKNQTDVDMLLRVFSEV